MSPVMREQRPLIGRLLAAQRVIGREDPGELAAPGELADQVLRETSEPAQQELLSPQQAGPFAHEACVEEQRRAQLEGQPPLDVAGEQLGGDRAAHVMGDHHERLTLEASREGLHDVGLRAQGVEMVARLV